ncbi:hypothetical protein DESUT3_27330 [Desulfuromonas versatilis]|uniref:Uncharacterized protein n=1 Tax=Desulfuromonas versatilis TaxID=2802975 RepID=A0ABM8HYP7_9BACT|nr:hypothetical protein DESUT3_27330 [Desulfuromonas versatilis]
MTVSFTPLSSNGKVSTITWGSNLNAMDYPERGGRRPGWGGRTPRPTLTPPLSLRERGISLETMGIPEELISDRY